MARARTRRSRGPWPPARPGPAPAGRRSPAVVRRAVVPGPVRAIARFSPDDRGDIGDRPDRREIRQGERRGRPAGLVAQQQLGDLERDAAPGQARVRVDRVRAMRIDHREGRRQHRRDAVVVRDDDVQAARVGGGDLGDARRAAVHGDDDARTRSRPPPRPPPATGRGPRRAGSGHTARRPRRTDGARGSGSSGRSGRPRRSRRRRGPARHASGHSVRRSSRRSASGSRAGSCRPSSGSANHASSSCGVGDAATREQVRQARREASGSGGCGERQAAVRPGRGRSIESAVRPRRQDATGRCTAPLPARRDTGIRTPSVALAGSATRRSGHADGRPTDASRRRSDWPRRSTSTSPRRSR